MVTKFYSKWEGAMNFSDLRTNVELIINNRERRNGKRGIEKATAMEEFVRNIDTTFFRSLN